MAPESIHPFRGELEILTATGSFNIHKLGAPAGRTEIPGGEEREFTAPAYAVTEYFSTEGKSHEDLVKFKQFYEDAQRELGNYLPQSMFVEGEPYGGGTGKSFYVVQKFDNSEFNKSAKSLKELNSREFSIEFLNQLLNIQEKINTFLERYAGEFPVGWLDENVLDPKLFKEDVLYSPAVGKVQITNFFRLNSEMAKKTVDSEGKFEPSKNRLVALNLLGMAGLVEKINWAIEKSAAPEWIKGQGVHWVMDKVKLEREVKKAMALTFDDGPNEETSKLLDILKEKGVKGTFFLVGSQIAGRESVVKRMIDEGHDVGVHEWGQEGVGPGEGLKEYSKRFVGPRKDLGDVKRTTELIEQVAGVRPVIGRVAGVHGTIHSLREFQAMGLEIVHGNPYDVIAIPPSKTLKAGVLFKKALSSNGQGKIRIFHIGAIKDGGGPTTRGEINYAKGEVFPPEETLKMIGQFIEESQKQGYEFVKVKDYLS